MVRLNQESDAGRGSDGRSDRLSPRRFAALYEKHYPELLGWFINRTHNGHQAVELTALTFVKALERRADFRGSTEREAMKWIYKIAYNELVDLYRHGKVEIAAIERLGFSLPPAAEDESERVEELIDASASTTPLREALDELSEHQREIFEAHVLEERSTAEIAAEREMTEVAVRMSLYRARRRLKSNRRLRSIVEGDDHG